jgi:uncharacterized damage-inducible protein DinB
MSWIAPPADVPTPPRPSAERASLDGFLDRHRALLLHKCAGLDGDQLARRPIPSSKLSLIGLVRHLAETDRIWFRWRFLGEDVSPLYWAEEYPEAPFDLAGPETAAADLAIFREEAATIRARVAGHSLDEVVTWGRERKQTDLRYVYIHMIEEYAQHNGHADLIRELVDGSTDAA